MTPDGGLLVILLMAVAAEVMLILTWLVERAGWIGAPPAGADGCTDPRCGCRGTTGRQRGQRRRGRR